MPQKDYLLSPVTMALGILSLFLFSACHSYKNIPYLQDVKDVNSGTVESANMAPYTDPKIQPKDILQISIQTLDPNSNAIAGTTSSTFSVLGNSSLTGGNSVPGFLVDQDGIIELPLVGKIKLAGMTTTEAREAIRSKASMYYKTPVVNVRYANFNITVMGEVAHPAQYTIPNEKTNILDAIGMAGDMTIYGKRENVLLIREVDGQKKFIRFNLLSSDIFQSPYFYLRQGDMIYVQPNKSKAASNDLAQVRNITIVSSVLSLLIVLITRVDF